MSDLTMLSLNQLPVEVLHIIFYHLDVPDILRVRRVRGNLCASFASESGLRLELNYSQVSRCLNEASRHRNVWNDAYRRAEFVRPPGPFPSQSTHDLEDMLATSFRVDRNIRHIHHGRSVPGPLLKPRRIQYRSTDLGLSLVFGQFLFIASRDKIRCCDLSHDNLRGTIVYQKAHGTIKSFHCVSATDGKGRAFACIVLSETMRKNNQISIYSLNVREKSEVTLGLLHQLEYAMTPYIHFVQLGPRMIVIQGRFGDRLDFVAMDVHSRTLFILPSFITALVEAVEKVTEHISTDFPTLPTSISTSTHLVLAWSYQSGAYGGWRTIFQAFEIHPTDTHYRFTSTSTPLSPSHSGIISDIHVSDTVLLHDSIFDPSTQDTLIAIRVCALESSSPPSFFLKHGILRLSAAPASDDHKIGTITFQLLGSFGRLSETPLLHPSFHGIGRAFYLLEPGLHGIISVLEYDLGASASGKNYGEQEAKVVEYPSVLRLPTPRRILDYDPYSGLICLQPLMKRDEVEIFDLSV
ncbi:hypothetical protein V8E55_005893 [Tylopilus felleus]